MEKAFGVDPAIARIVMRFTEIAEHVRQEEKQRLRVYHLMKTLLVPILLVVSLGLSSWLGAYIFKSHAQIIAIEWALLVVDLLGAAGLVYVSFLLLRLHPEPNEFWRQAYLSLGEEFKATLKNCSEARQRELVIAFSDFPLGSFDRLIWQLLGLIEWAKNDGHPVQANEAAWRMLNTFRPPEAKA